MQRFETLLWLLVALSAVAATVGVGAALSRTAAFSDSIPPCTYEDASGQPLPCVWIAPERGNREGRSFVAIEGRDGEPVLVYLDDEAREVMTPRGPVTIERP